MKIAVLGSGQVGQSLARGYTRHGHDVVIGTRKSEVEGLPVATPDLAVADADLVVLGVAGRASVELAGSLAHLLDGKVLVDATNPLDFSGGFPPTLSVCNTDSVGEQLQREFPEARVVKTLNTVNAVVMTDPGLLAGGDHHLFVSGNDPDAKSRVKELLSEWFGWRNVIDLGDITTARGTEMYLPLWLRLMSVNGPAFNIKVVVE